VTANIDVSLSGGDRDGDVLFYAPLDEVAGSVRVTAESHLAARHIWLRLIWFSEGRADEDVERLDELDIGRGDLQPGEMVRSEFRFQLPPAPWSYAGTYVSIVWAIEAVIDRPMARDIVHRERFVMRPPAAR
jgi:hypothetical protein